MSQGYYFKYSKEQEKCEFEIPANANLTLHSFASSYYIRCLLILIIVLYL